MPTSRSQIPVRVKNGSGPGKSMKKTTPHSAKGKTGPLKARKKKCS